MKIWRPEKKRTNKTSRLFLLAQQGAPLCDGQQFLKAEISDR